MEREVKGAKGELRSLPQVEQELFKQFMEFLKSRPKQLPRLCAFCGKLLEPEQDICPECHGVNSLRKVLEGENASKPDAKISSPR